MLYMPDASAAAEAQMFLEEKMAQMDSAGGIVECVIQGVPAGIGEAGIRKAGCKSRQSDLLDRRP